MLANLVKRLFGTQNDRELKNYKRRLILINALEEKYACMSDDELKKEFEALKNDIRLEQRTLDDVLNDVFAITREVAKRTLNMRHFDVQIIGGLVLNDGRIAEMKTGEGKTLVATLPVVLNAMSGNGVHVVTVNDYLAKRDAEQMSAIYNFLGLSVGVIISGIRDDKSRQEQYACDITYGTNNEFGFDYLRDNMKYSINEKVQRSHQFVIVDEVDSILIDEARTPLIISGPSSRKLETYELANNVAMKLVKERDFTTDEKNRTVVLTEEGIANAEKLFGVDNLYSFENAILSHQLDQALKAHNLFSKDVDYVVKDGEVVIVDEFRGRLSEGRRFSEGLHQALEAKEGVKIQEESQTLADITFQNYFRLYKKLAGMTGTAQTEATEFSQIYGLEVISIPTNVPVVREDKVDLVFSSEREKFNAVIDEIKKAYTKGQPVLVGTASIEKSEELHNLLVKAKIPHTVLNAKNHEKEAQIILGAGQKGAITVATNMAGRGVDIKIDDEVRALGGLYIIGTERHESRRIDNQLRGRAGRQGDPGMSRFYLSLEDNLLRIFGGDRLKSIFEKIGVKDGESIESRMVTNAVEKAQKKVESLHFESRKHILEYDDVANEQRKTVYNFRNELIDPHFDIAKKIDEIRENYVDSLLSRLDIHEAIDKKDINVDDLVVAIKEDLMEIIPHESLDNLEFKELRNVVNEILKASYDSKMAVFEKDQRSYVERIYYLQNLDTTWREHLYQMDILKTGIGLRSYNQRDPLVEYKKESYALFMELVELIKVGTYKALHIVRFRHEMPQEEQERMQKMVEEMEDEINENMTLVNKNLLSDEDNSKQKISRNGPCPCGSGKKYKQCCGKSGPKRGKLA